MQNALQAACKKKLTSRVVEGAQRTMPSKWTSGESRTLVVHNERHSCVGERMMDSDAGHASMTTRLKQHKRRRESPVALGSFDVAQLVPERPMPDWVRHRVKRAGIRRKAAAPPHGRFRAGEVRKLDFSSTKSGTSIMLLDLNNMRKDWKSSSTKRLEAVRRARISKNRRPEAVRGFPGIVRPTGTLSDSPVALFAQSTNLEQTGDILGSQTACEPPEIGLEFEGVEEGKQESKTPLLMDKTYLTLDQSKLPLEVSRSRMPSLSSLSYRLTSRNLIFELFLQLD